MPLKRLTIETIGGLSNRLMALDSAISLSKSNGYELHLVWPLFKGLNCRFDELLLSPDVIKTISYPVEYSAIKLVSNLKVSARKLSRAVSKRYFDLYIDKRSTKLDTKSLVIRNASLKGAGLIVEPQYSNVFIRTDRRYCFNPNPYAFLEPVPIVKAYVAKALSDLPLGSCFGMHIRRTDNIWSIDQSPTYLFHSKAKEIFQQYPDALIYLATDDQDIEEEFKRKYREKIITYEKPSLSRSSITGLHHALVEILLLSHTREIFGCYGSSFSTLAAEIGGIPIRILQK